VRATARTPFLPSARTLPPMKLNTRGLVHRLGGQKQLLRTLVANGHEITLDGIEKWCSRGSIPGVWIPRLQVVADELGVEKRVTDILKEPAE
jgi:hypothetical protein